jgi:uncharacterized protein YlxW (UPF0749 family)
MILSKKEILLAFGLILGFLVFSQGKSMGEAKENLVRDTNTSIFQEIKILKNKNKELNKDLDNLNNNFEKLSNQDLAIEAIKDDINKYKKTSGKYPIFGPGVEIIIESSVSPQFMIDLINELYNSSANAVSINGIRITNQRNGIDSMPNGQLFIDSFVFSTPYKINAIGDANTIKNLILAPNGFIQRAIDSNQGMEVLVQNKDIIQMD